MVYFDPVALDRTFAALSDPTRRAMLARLSEHGTQTASELAAPFDVSLPAILKHLGVLAAAGLVRREKTGRTVHCELEAAPMRDAIAWLERYERFWSARLDALAAYVEEDATCPARKPRASPSNATSRPRSRRSSRPGRGPRR
jgi:DNA-binding transcriptional ArsR family regulator